MSRDFSESLGGGRLDLLGELGYDSGDKLLIVHADDVGMCHSVNAATFERLMDGSVSSASLMAPCPWILEAVEFFKENRGCDVGVHSTLTSEWRFYRWRPLTAAKGLIDEDGFLPSTVGEVASRASPAEVMAELEAQVGWLASRGVELSHLDTHMGTVYARPEFLEAYLEVARNHQLIPMVPSLRRELIEAARAQGLPVDELRSIIARAPVKLDYLLAGVPGHTLDEKARALTLFLKSLEPGTVSQVIVHLGLDTDELRAIIGDGYRERYFEYLLVGSSDVERMLESLGIHLISWRDLKPLLAGT
ncbi:MAG: hypothetical protein DRK00_08150 [Thermoprotei archaeon]|nr:MAG: hypothetical protein DRK00_08150 [Thermoprotei archaeon]